MTLQLLPSHFHSALTWPSLSSGPKAMASCVYFLSAVLGVNYIGAAHPPSSKSLDLHQDNFLLSLLLPENKALLEKKCSHTD